MEKSAQGVPEPVTPGGREDATAELGSEGGSYGDLTQTRRMRLESGASRSSEGRGHATWRRVARVLWLVLILVAVWLGIVFWWP